MRYIKNGKEVSEANFFAAIKGLCMEFKEDEDGFERGRLVLNEVEYNRIKRVLVNGNIFYKGGCSFKIERDVSTVNCRVQFIGASYV